MSRNWAELWRRHIIDDVEPGNARCEFVCRVEVCDLQRWVTCENRVREMLGILGQEGFEPPGGLDGPPVDGGVAPGAGGGPGAGTGT
jgi:hypothetical protein